jgi:plasmid stabilization system protein ParE
MARRARERQACAATEGTASRRLIAMARIELAPGVFDDFERIIEHLDRHGSTGGPSRIETIPGALDVLAHSPRVGRATRGGLRGLVIGSGARGYVALYRFSEAMDEVTVLAIRAQREADG